jgi:hypothetical protein
LALRLLLVSGSETFGSAGAWAHARTPRNLVTRKREEPEIENEALGKIRGLIEDETAIRNVSAEHHDPRVRRAA